MGGGYTYDPSRTKGAADKLIDQALKEIESEEKTGKVFISRHISDEYQVNLLRYQASDKKTSLNFKESSSKKRFPEPWKEYARKQIANSDALIVMIGPKTAERKAVDWEIKEAYRQNKTVIAVRIYRNKYHSVPKAVEEKTPVIKWNLNRISREIKKGDS